MPFKIKDISYSIYNYYINVFSYFKFRLSSVYKLYKTIFKYIIIMNNYYIIN